MVVVLLFGWSCLFQVPETESVIVARFGNPIRVIDDAGLHFKWPLPVDSLIRIDRRLHVLDPEPAEYLTSEKKNVLVDSFRGWSVADPLKFAITVTDIPGAEARLTDIMRSEVGTIIGQHPLSVLVWAPESAGMSRARSGDAGSAGENGSGDEAPAEETLTMDDITEEITSHAAARALESFGIKVAALRIKRLNFPLQNKTAVFRRMEAERERIARQYRSEGDEEAEKIKARTDVEEAGLVNDGMRRAEEIRGNADAEATRIYAEAYGESPELYEFLRSLEVYGKIIRENSTLVVPDDARLLEVLRNPDGAIDRARRLKPGDREVPAPPPSDAGSGE